MITKINHIGIAVNRIEDAARLYTEILGLSIKYIEKIADQKIRTAIISVGESKIELIESTDPEGSIAKFIASRGEGLHHIALEVNNLERILKVLTKSGIPLIDEKPRKGVEQTIIAFLHPKGTGGVLLELVQS